MRLRHRRAVRRTHPSTAGPPAARRPRTDRRTSPTTSLPQKPAGDPIWWGKDMARPVAQIGYWQANGGVTYEDPDGREVVFASWIYLPPGS